MQQEQSACGFATLWYLRGIQIEKFERKIKILLHHECV